MRGKLYVMWLPLLLVCCFSSQSLWCQPLDVGEMSDLEIINELLTNLELRENILQEREQILSERERSLSVREQRLGERLSWLDERERSITLIETSLQNYSDALKREITLRNVVIVVVAALGVWGWIR